MKLRHLLIAASLAIAFVCAPAIVAAADPPFDVGAGAVQAETMPAVAAVVDQAVPMLAMTTDATATIEQRPGLEVPAFPGTDLQAPAPLAHRLIADAGGG